MGIYSEAPGVLSWAEVKPTLLVCWWMTIFCLIIILLRVAGRFIRSEQLFVEDRTVGFAIIPLFLRMGCVHAILIFGTNNVDFGSSTPSARDLHHRSIASGLVIASRIFHAATLWILKITILEFFQRISDAVSERFSDVAIKVIRGFLLATFIAVVISDLAECQPFTHYWQVLPDPGGKCRQGFAQLITVSVCNVLTDLLLVLLPIRIILQSRQALKRKIQLSLLFSLSLGVVGVTIYRAKRVIEEHGDQQLRSLIASVELLFATAAANSLVLGSFVRDRGVKKNKYRNNSTADSIDRASINRSRRPTANRHWGSDEDLVRGLGLGVERSLRETPDDFPAADGVLVGSETPALRVDDMTGGPAVAQHAHAHPNINASDVYSPNNLEYRNGETGVQELDSWQFPDRRRSGATNSARSGQSRMSVISGQSDDDALLRNPHSPAYRQNSSARRVSFYESGSPVGNLSELEGDSYRDVPDTSLRAPVQRPLDQAPPSPAYTASNRGVRRGSTALISDLGGYLGPPTGARHRPRTDVKTSSLQTVYQGSEVYQGPGTMPSSRPSLANPKSPDSFMDDMTPTDAGGLLK